MEPPPFFDDPLREDPLELEADADPPARRQRRRELEGVEPRAVLRLVGLAVQRPAHLLPVRAAGEREALERGVVVVEQLVAAVVGEPAAVRIDHQIERDVRDRRLRRVLPGRQVLLPVVPPLLLEPGALVAVVDGDPEGDAGGERHHGEGGEAQRRVPERPRLQAVDAADGVRLPPSEEAHGEDGEQPGEPQGQDPAEDESLAVELEDPHVAPAHRAPEPPVPHPGHAVGELEVEAEEQRAEAGAIGDVALAEGGLDDQDEAGPDQEGGHQQQPPDEQEGAGVGRQLPLDEDGDGAADIGGDRHQHADRAVGERLAEEERGGARRGREGDRGEAGRALALQRLGGVEHQEQADEDGEHVHPVHRGDARGDQQLGLERPQGGQAVAQGLQQDEGAEQVDAGRGEQVPQLRAGHLQGARDEPDRPRAASAAPPERRAPPAAAAGWWRRRRARRPPRPPSASRRPLEMGGQVPLREPDPGEPEGQEGQAREDERQVEPDAGRVVEAGPAVELDPGLVDPAEAGGIDQHQQPVDPRVEPGRRPAPEEEAAEPS